MWPEFSRLVAEIRPLWVVAENVPGIIKLAGDNVCESLERIGYSVGVWNFEAAAVGALHRRARVFFVGEFNRQIIPNAAGIGYERQGKSGIRSYSAQDGEGEAALPVSGGIKGERGAQSRMGGVAHGLPAWLDGRWWRVEPDIPRTAKGVKDRANRLKALGNAVVPAQAYLVFRAIAEIEASYSASCEEEI